MQVVISITLRKYLYAEFADRRLYRLDSRKERSLTIKVFLHVFDKLRSVVTVLCFFKVHLEEGDSLSLKDGDVKPWGKP